jgi:hypothetical protein
LVWLGRLDSNQDKRIQSPLCYHCTTPQLLSEKSPRIMPKNKGIEL